MESPGPGHGHRGFLVQRNHESGGIVIAMILPLGAALQQRVEATSCNRDFFTILNPASAHFSETAGLKATDLKSTLRDQMDCAMAHGNGHRHPKREAGPSAAMTRQDEQV